VDRSEGEGGGGGDIVVWYQNNRPEHASGGICLYWGSEKLVILTKSDEVVFEGLEKTLELRQTTSSQLVTALMCCAIPNFESGDKAKWMGPDERKVPIKMMKKSNSRIRESQILSSETAVANTLSSSL
jgi:hypothetical protein